MEVATNGVVGNGVGMDVDVSNGLHVPDLANDAGHVHESHPTPMMEELERELPVVYDGQVPLGELVSRIVQTIYAELSEMAETCVYFQFLSAWTDFSNQLYAHNYCIMHGKRFLSSGHGYVSHNHHLEPPENVL
jgi:hypothetical protein